jgi:hypothetical protein
MDHVLHCALLFNYVKPPNLDHLRRQNKVSYKQSSVISADNYYNFLNYLHSDKST